MYVYECTNLVAALILNCDFSLSCNRLGARWLRLPVPAGWKNKSKTKRKKTRKEKNIKTRKRK
jgi:hypothetical protein